MGSFPSSVQKFVLSGSQTLCTVVPFEAAEENLCFLR